MRIDRSAQCLRRAIEALTKQIEETPTPELAAALRDMLTAERDAEVEKAPPPAFVKDFATRIAKLEEAVTTPRVPRERPLTMGRVLG